MSRPLLLIVDGESLKSPALVASLELDGWDIRWASNQEARHYIDWGLEPSLLLLDPAHGGEGSFDVAKLFLARHPGLPVLVLQGEDTAPYANFPKTFKGYLTKSDATETWPSALRGYKPNAAKSAMKLSSEDIFGDLLADLEGEAPPVVPAPVQRAESLTPEAPLPPVPPAPAASAPLSTPVSTPPPTPARTPAQLAGATAVPVAPVAPLRAPVPKTAETKPVVPSIQLPKFQVPAPKAPAPPPVAKIHVDPFPRLQVPQARPAAPAPGSTPSPVATQAMQMVPSTLGAAGAMEPFVPPPVVAPPSPKTGLDSDDIFGGLLDELEGPPSSPPNPAFEGQGFSQAMGQPQAKPLEPGATPRPSAQPPSPPALQSAMPVTGGVPEEPAAPHDDEYTLSGISGIHDPFALEAQATGTAGPTTVERPLAAPVPPTPSPVGSVAFPDSSEPAPANVLEEFGNYYLLEKIAVGGMAELFKARQRGVQGFQKIVAIKRILPHLSDNDEFVTMFIDEAKLAAQLTHPNIVQIFDLGKASGSYYIAMEFVDGRDLRSLLRKVREYHLPFPEPVAAFVAMKVAVALDHAHRKKGLNDKELKLVHRDISPQNILISYDGAVKLVDFGIAKAATKNTQTMAGALKGKLLYMSPEQALGQPLDNRSDLYSLGLVLFELLTGERCFQADSELGVLEKVRMGRVSDVQSLNPAISREMAAIVNKTLQKNVESRYPSARFLERDLKDLLVRQSSEPTDHDVAEYVNALLKGTKEQVEEVLAARFAIRAPLAANRSHGQPGSSILERPGSKLEDQQTATAVVPKPGLAQIPIPLPEMEHLESNRPGWLVPAIIAVILVLVFLFYIYGMATHR